MSGSKTPKFSWSYSAVSAFDTCPRKFYYERVLKKYPFERGAAAIYGEKMHKAVELYGSRDVEPDKEFKFIKKKVDIVKRIPGVKYWERQMAFDQNMNPTSWFDKSTWLRAQVDFACINNKKHTAWVVDWKSNSSSKYADTSQLELMALTIFEVHPEIHKVNAGLAFMVVDEFIPATYERQYSDNYWQRWNEYLDRLEHAYDSGVWNPKPNGLCKRFCPVTSCEFNGNYKGD